MERVSGRPEVTMKPARKARAASPTIVRRLPAIMAAAAGFYLAAIYAECIARSCSTSRFEIAFLAGLAVVALVTALSLVAWHRFTAAILAVAIPCFAAVYLFEAVATNPRDRHRAQMLDELSRHRARGIEAVPQWTPYGFAAGKGMLPLSDGSEVVPLTGPSGRLVLMCQEGARPITTYRADEFGLNNPPEAWRTATQVLFVGDSFTHGACVDNAAHFVHAVRQHYRGTVNVGYSGNGPLIELAGIREYARHLRPAFVFWMYDEANDVLSYSPPSDLDVEISHPILSKYLSQPDFTQNLLARQDLVNAAVNAMAATWALAAPERTIKQHLLLPTTREVLRDAYVRIRMSLPFVLAHEAPVSDARIAQFAEIVRLAANEVGGWGGRLVFVNLPAHLPACLGRDHPSRQALLDVPRRLGLDLIDLEGPLFDLALAQGAHVIAAQPPCAGHYSEQGYGVVADVLLEYLRIVQGEPLRPFWSASVRPDGDRQLIYAGRVHDRTKPLRP
jgi:hypothetical protein